MTTRHVVSDSDARDSDEQLLERCRRGDAEAWEVLIARYEALVYSTALDVGLDRDDAGDVFQDVWVELHRSVGRIRNPKALPRWLIVATRRLAYKRAVYARRASNPLSSDLVDPNKLPLDTLTDLESRRRVEAALSELDDRCATLLRRLFLTRRRPSYAKLAGDLGIAIGSVGPIRNRCLERLRRIMRDLP